MGENELAFCKDCKEHKQHVTEIKNIKDAAGKLESSLKEDMNEIVQQHKEDVKMMDEKLKGDRAYFNGLLDKFQLEIQKVVSENQQLREAIIEIKNTITGANEKSALLFAQVTRELNDMSRRLDEIFENKKATTQHLIYPIITGVVVAVIMGILGFMAGKAF